ncbi:MAG: hypothetical protein OEW93_08895 [Candidatus Bathyarchaeota archaeon]|nr:hypothetical protein [Candidatus Bathyarchaeota archaeon]MDH5791112.1 hypothetical protein [Candidatus Bathyarchaeota archaeon]
MSADEERLAELETAAALLFERRDGLNREAERRRKERDRLNESVRSLRANATEERDKRDELNRRVAEIKKRMEGFRQELGAKREELARLDGGDERRRLPPRGKLEEELRRIEWELSTTPTLEMLDREARLSERAGEIRRALEEHERLDAEEDRRLISLAGSKAVEVEIRRGREEMRELHEASQGHHEKMLQLHRQADEEKERADEAHVAFMESVSALKEVNAELDGVLGEAREIRGRLRRAERSVAARRAQEIEAMKRELKEEAQRKLDRGEKLSLEELKLLYGEDEEEEEPP